MNTKKILDALNTNAQLSQYLYAQFVKLAESMHYRDEVAKGECTALMNQAALLYVEARDELNTAIAKTAAETRVQLPVKVKSQTLARLDLAQDFLESRLRTPITRTALVDQALEDFLDRLEKGTMNGGRL